MNNDNFVSFIVVSYNSEILFASFKCRGANFSSQITLYCLFTRYPSSTSSAVVKYSLKPPNDTKTSRLIIIAREVTHLDSLVSCPLIK